MNKEEINKLLKDNPIKIIKFNDIEVPVEYLKQTTVNINGDDYIKLQQQNKKYKEVIDKAHNFIINHLRQDMLSDFTGANYIQEYIVNPDELLDILKEVE